MNARLHLTVRVPRHHERLAALPADYLSQTAKTGWLPIIHESRAGHT
jgi:hypothetical protein